MSLASMQSQPRSSADNPAEVVILGGGLAGGLAALALCDAGRGADVLLIERESRLGGNHTWSFHETDLNGEQHRLVAPLVAHRWPRHMVRFPQHERTLETGYASITGEDLARVVTARLLAAGGRVLLNAAVTSGEDGVIRLEDGRVVRGDVILDARGARPPAPDARAGYQKFVGLEVQLRSDGPWTVPLVMDATVPQVGGYRFTYVLPFTRRRVLIEDTVYSTDGSLDIAQAESHVWSYVRDNGAAIERIHRREIGVLPLPLSMPTSVPAARRSGGARAAQQRAGLVPIGYRGGFFHPVTGYSLPLAARVAMAIARASTSQEVGSAVAAVARELRGQQRFDCLLNRLLFQAMAPAVRWNALDRFYRLPDATIARFYASQSTLWDRARVLCGRPPRGVSPLRLLRPATEET